MPKETIASLTVTDDHVFTRSLHIAWGAKGGRPEAPDGWVNAGFAEVQICEDHGSTGSLTGITLDTDEIGHLIRVLKRVRRQTAKATGVQVHLLQGMPTPSEVSAAIDANRRF